MIISKDLILLKNKISGLKNKICRVEWVYPDTLWLNIGNLREAEDLALKKRGLKDGEWQLYVRRYGWFIYDEQKNLVTSADDDIDAFRTKAMCLDQQMIIEIDVSLTDITVLRAVFTNGYSLHICGCKDYPYDVETILQDGIELPCWDIQTPSKTTIAGSPFGDFWVETDNPIDLYKISQDWIQNVGN